MTTSSQSTDSTTTTPPTTQTSTTGYETPPVETPPAPADDFGYGDMSGQVDAPVETPPAETPPVETPPKENSTGYGEPTAEEKAEAEKAALAEKAKEELSEEDLKDADKLLRFEIKESLGKLPEGLDKDKIEAFVLENKMSKEQVDAYVKYSQTEAQQISEGLEQAKKQQKVDWSNELKNDESFGGDNFNINIDRAEKMLGDHLPNLKKALTERGSMLPPYIMKDLANLYKTLNPKTTLVNGDPSIKVADDEENYLEAMYK